MVLCEKGCFNQYVQDTGSGLANYVRTEKHYTLYIIHHEWNKVRHWGLNISMSCFHGALCEKVFTACERLTAGQSPGGDNFNVYILRVLMSKC